MLDLTSIQGLVKDCLEQGFRKVNSSTGEVIQVGSCIADLGDILPAFLYSDNCSTIQKYVGQCVDYKPVFDDEINLCGCRFNRLYEYSDYFFGLYLLLNYGQTDSAKVRARVAEFNANFESSRRLRYLLPVERGALGDAVSTLSGLVRPNEDFGMFLELQTLFKPFEVALLPKVDLEKQLSVSQLSSGVLPVYQAGYISRLLTSLLRPSAVGRFLLHKETVNLLFGMLAKMSPCDSCPYHSIIKDFLKAYFSRVSMCDGLFSRIVNGRCDLDLTIFHLLDFVVGYSAKVKDDQYLTELVDRLIPVLQEKRGATGLLPFELVNRSGYKRINIPSEASWLDSSVDMSVALSKLYSVDGALFYRDLSHSLADCVLEHHGNNYGCSNTVGIDDGKVFDSRCAVKTLALVGKLFIARDGSSGEIAPDGCLAPLLEDR